MNLERISTLWLHQHFANQETQVRVTLPNYVAVMSARQIVKTYNARYLGNDPQPINMIANGNNILLIRTRIPIEQIREQEKNNQNN